MVERPFYQQLVQAADRAGELVDATASTARSGRGASLRLRLALIAAIGPTQPYAQR